MQSLHRLAAGLPAARLPAMAWRGLAIAALLLLAACKVELYSGLDQREANEMVAILLAQGIPAERRLAKDQTLTVQVEESRFAAAVALLKAHGLPRERFATMDDVFAGDGLISSPVEERARLIYALSQELSRTVSAIDGVLSARIHVVLPENEGMRSNATPSSASVFIRHYADADIAALTPQIKQLVANSIEGLVYDKVSVVLIPGAARPDAAAAGEALTTVAGLWVHQASALRATLIIYPLLALALAALAGNLVLWRLWRRGAGTRLPARLSASP